MRISVKTRKRFMAFSKQKLGHERAYRYRDNLKKMKAQVLRQSGRLKSMTLVRPYMAMQLTDTQLALTSRFIDPQKTTKRIGIRYVDNSIQWVDEHIAHFCSTDSSLKSISIPAQTPDQIAGVIDCEQPCSKIVAIVRELADGKTKQIKIKTQKPSGDPMPTVKHLLNLIASGETRKRELYDHVLGKMIAGVWNTRSTVESENELIAYNEHYAPETPEVSLIIPIYGRYDFISHQLAQFASDPDMRRHEIIYVIDDPRLASEVRESCHYLAPIYHVAFKVLYLENNLGYAGANNAGAKVAQADKLLLLNSDVFPCNAGWLGEMVTRSGDDLNNTVVGARLLYDDESIQHDGMSFQQVFWLNNLWINEHDGKGLPASVFTSSNSLEPRECVTGACMLMTKANYDAVGGFDEDYILGDFEDSDLCMKVRKNGVKIAIIEDITLYHLERQSQSMVTPDRWKTELTYYNCWQHTNKWHGSIEKLKQEMSNV